MKLSEAIRAGAKLRPQDRGDFFFKNRSCALGAAYEGAGLGQAHTETAFAIVQRLEKEWPALSELHDGEPLKSLIADRNDEGWTREEIADWIEHEIENKWTIDDTRREIEELIPEASAGNTQTLAYNSGE